MSRPRPSGSTRRRSQANRGGAEAAVAQVIHSGEAWLAGSPGQVPSSRSSTSRR